MRQQLIDLAGGVPMNADQNIGEVAQGLDALLFARCDECVENREVVARPFVSDEEKVRTAKGHSAKGRLRTVVVGWDRRVAKKAPESAVIPDEVSESAPHTGPRFELAAQSSRPDQQACEQ